MRTIKIHLTAYCLLAYCLLASCFHKDVMNDRADDLTQSFIYTGKGGPYIITQETIFQATSKESGGGVTHISGYNECRLTCYDLATGAMLGRVELGEEMECKCEILGVVSDEIWCYSIDAELGLHSRDPKTLELIKAEKDYTGLASVDLARPEWSTITDYYAFDFVAGKMMLTDMQGVHYYFDPVANTAERTENEMPEDDWSPDYLGNNAYFTMDSFASFEGNDDRQKLQWAYEDSTGELSFLDPSFLVDNNEQHAINRLNEQHNGIQSHIDDLKTRRDSILTAHPILSESETYTSWSKMTEVERGLKNEMYTIDRQIEDAQRDLDDLTGPYARDLDYALNDKRYSVLIYSASSVSDTAHAIISCVDCQSKKFTERWHLDLPAFYFDPGKAESAGVFDDGDPEFSYRWADIHDGKLVMIAQLQMVCVDMTTGKKLWEIQL